MTDMLSGYYVTQRLLAELQRYDLRGYITGGTVSVDISEDFFIAYPDAPGVPEALRDLQLLHNYRTL
jgi:hypothetical protein